ncbi:tRNA-uridine aminocarboxypropyltransferase [Zooshikella harenae]|uniref:tRNA-uridine aminocarboxypropyltransferase n=1 Tax=Zooshikella harenae TaxID=2827238 RepID=A0ABS5ZCT0_9GAMM|nr:DTW domain-containing protein [Zooshikella harenae]MBU2711775.1 DTW domain-containing protein [Zooshikella harenae]
MTNSVIQSRPFRARGAYIQRCSQCRVPTVACICAFTPTLDSKATFWLLMHPYERYKPTNTGQLLVDTLPNVAMYDWYRTMPNDDLLSRIHSEQYTPILVFPDDMLMGNPVMTATRLPEITNPAFVLLDGTWQQARKIYRKSDYLHQLPVVSINAQQLSRYQLRRSQNQGNLATAEVVIHLLAAMGETQSAQLLADYFQVFNYCYISGKNNHAPKDQTPEMERLLTAKSTASI